MNHQCKFMCAKCFKNNTVWTTSQRLSIVVSLLLLVVPASRIVVALYKTPLTCKAVLLDPFNHEFRLLRDYQPSIDNIINYLKHSGFTVDYYRDYNVTIDLLKRLDDEGYGVVYINTHGYIDSKGRVRLLTGEAYTLEKERLFQEDLREERMGCLKPEEDLPEYPLNFDVTPEFISLYGNNTRYPYTLVFIDACYSTYNPSMAKAFLDLEAGSYVGWTTSVGVEFGALMDAEFFRQMCVQNETVAEATKGMRADSYTGARMTYFGDGDLALVAVLPAPTQESPLTAVTVLTVTIPVLISVYALIKYRRRLKRAKPSARTNERSF